MIEDSTVQGALALGLRERKKQRTRETIARVALELFDRQGYHATTIAQIAEAADVSPRTISAYFPAKEELAFPYQAESFERLEQRLRDRQPDETAPEAMRAWIDGELPTWLGRERELNMQRRVVAADEGLRDYKQRYNRHAHELMTEAIARDLDASPHDLEPRMAAAATAAILDLLEEQHEPPAETNLAEWHAEAMLLIDRAMLFVSGGIRALAAKPRR